MFGFTIIKEKELNELRQDSASRDRYCKDNIDARKEIMNLKFEVSQLKKLMPKRNSKGQFTKR